MVGKLILELFHSRTAAHVLHLKTRSYAAHVALNEFYDAIIGFADALAETWQGEYGLIQWEKAEPYTLPTDAVEMLDDLRECVDECSAEFHKDDTHLNNICDEIRALIATTQYKLKFLK